MTLTKEQFLKDVEQHQLHILHEDGVYRHLRFKKPGTGCMHFDFVTWPGYLAYSGDMGTFVFKRLHDMLEFFRPSERAAEDPFRWIDRSYWHEKLEGSYRGEGAKEFDHERYVQVIKEWRTGKIRDEMRGYVGHRPYTKEQRRAFWDDVEESLLDDFLDTGEHACMQRAYDFRHNVYVGHRYDNTFGLKTGPVFQLEDFWEHNFHKWTDRFEWCCFALRWGVMTYDKAKAAGSTS